MSVSVHAVIGPGRGWELSFYDMQRTPQEAINDQTEIGVSPRSLQSELKCPICLDTLKNTMIAKDCLHRFCSECIITSIRSGYKECPTCRKKLLSKRYLRQDPNFDRLIDKLCPRRYEEIEERVLVKPLFPGLLEIPTAANIRHLLDTKSGSSDSAASSEASGSNQAEVVFKPNPSEMLADPLMKRLKESTRYIKTPDHATIDHLSKYLAMRLTLDNIDFDMTDNMGLVNFCIFIAPNPGQLVLLNGNHTIKQVSEKYWKADSPVEMYYSICRKT